jgi:cytochrome c oxidase cbb3-type subunit 3
MTNAEDAQVHVDSLTGTQTTGHEWDGIRELNTPLPRWWLTIFYCCIAFAVVYCILYPAIPLRSSFTKGLLGWSSRGAAAEDVAALHATRAPMTAALAKASLPDIEQDPQLLVFARALGKAAFGDNCAACHGAGGGGSPGFPNLNADRWLWGGTLDDIVATITHGARSGDDQGHSGNMPDFGRENILTAAQISTLADYVRSLSGLAVEPNADLQAGAKLFADNCAACHGANAKGNPQVGAPNLTSKIWLYGSDKSTIVATITNGRGGVMPAWGRRLDSTTIKALAVYVHTLGGGD